MKKPVSFDQIDLAIIETLERDGDLSQRDLAERVGLSQNACWRRLKRLEADGLVGGARKHADYTALGLDLTVFVMIKTRHHAREWSDSFRSHVESLPEVTEFYRIGGSWDYMIKAVTAGMAGYDRFYQALIADFDIETVSGIFTMEAIVENRPLDLRALVR